MKDNKYKSFLAFSFSAGFKSPNLPIATFTQNGKELNFIIDTGSDDNVISAAALKNIEHVKVEHDGALMGINGGAHKVEACVIKFEKDKDSFEAKFLVSDSLQQTFDIIRECHAIPLHGMLGSMFLAQNNIVLDFKSLTAYNNKK